MVPQESSRKISEQVGRVTQERESPEGHARLMSRRRFLRHAGLTAAAMALLQAPQVLSGRGWIQPVYAAKPDLVHDTFNGLLAFVVPGSDTYSKHQGVSTAEPGGVDAGITDVLIASMDQQCHSGQTSRWNWRAFSTVWRGGQSASGRSPLHSPNCRSPRR